MNFAEFPIALLTDRVPKGQNVIKFEDRFTTRKKVFSPPTDHRRIEGIWPAYGDR